MLHKIVILGNSGSGKSTLAKKLAEKEKLAHLDLDTLAWLPTSPPKRQSIDVSRHDIEQFMSENDAWVIEGCYSDLLDIALPQATELIFLNLPLDECIANAQRRPWEPHKYSSKQAQDENLSMLIEWIKQYYEREDTFSYQSHKHLFDSFKGPKKMIEQNQERS